MGPGHNVRYDGGTRNSPAPFSFSDEVNGRVDCNSHQATRSAFQNPKSSGAKSDRSLSVAGQQERIQHPSSRLGRNSTDSVADKSKKQKGIPFCMIHSCQSISEPCKRKLKLCSEHKVCVMIEPTIGEKSIYIYPRISSPDRLLQHPFGKADMSKSRGSLVGILGLLLSLQYGFRLP